MHTSLKSESAVKRTVQAQIAATKAFPKIAAMLNKLTAKIKFLKKEALKNYLKRKKEDAKKAAAKKSRHESKSSAMLVVLSDSLEDAMLDREADISESDLAECCALPVSNSVVSVQTTGEKAKESARFKKEINADPKAALRKKQMSAAMRIRENKDIRVEVKELLAKKKKLQDQAWAMYVNKVAKKSVATKPAEKKPVAKPVSRGPRKPNKNRPTMSPAQLKAHQEKVKKQAIDECTKYAAAAGFDLKNLSFPDEGYKFKVGSEEYTSGGSYDRITGKVTIVAHGRSSVEKQVAILAHELQHHKYTTVKNAYEKERFDMTYPEENKFFDGKKIRPEHAEELAERFPVIAKLKATRFNPDKRELYKASDGCTPYSAAYWKAVSVDTLDLAFNETLAEVAKLEHLGKLEGKTLREMGVKPEWEELHNIYNGLFDASKGDKK